MTAPAPAVSVVVPAYNRRDVAVRAVASVLAQTLADLEVVVVDDGSTDGTADAVAALADPRVTVVRTERAGAAAARNTGVAHARGRWLTFLDSDDTVEPGWLEAMVSAVEAEGAVLVSCGVAEHDRTGERRRVRLPDDGGPALAGVRSLVTTGGSYLLDRELFLAAGGFDPEQRAAQHTELALRLLPDLVARGLRTTTVDEPLVNRFVGRDDHIRGDDAAVYEGGRRLIAKHRAQLARDPRQLGNVAASAAYRAVRVGEVGEARRLLWLAARTDPARPRHWARLALTLVPPLARRVWSAPEVEQR